MHARVLPRALLAMLLGGTGSLLLGSSLDPGPPGAGVWCGAMLLVVARAVVTFWMPSSPSPHHLLLHPRGAVRTHALEWTALFVAIYQVLPPRESAPAWIAVVFTWGLLVLTLRATVSVRHLIEKDGKLEVTGLLNGLRWEARSEEATVELDVKGRLVLSRPGQGPVVAGRFWLDLAGTKTVDFVMERCGRVSEHILAIARATAWVVGDAYGFVVHALWVWGGVAVLVAVMPPGLAVRALAGSFAALMLFLGIVGLVRDRRLVRSLVRQAETLPDTMVLRPPASHLDRGLRLAGVVALVATAVATALPGLTGFAEVVVACAAILGTRLGLSLLEAAGRRAAAGVVAATVAGTSVDLFWPWLLRVRAVPVAAVQRTGTVWRLGEAAPVLLAASSEAVADRFHRAVEEARHGGYR